MQLIDLLILTISFLVYKVIFILIPVLSSFLNVYDTSTLLILEKPKNILQKIIVSLVRWDSVYFIILARRGRLFEQEWAFGPVFPHTVRLFTDHIFLSKSLYNYAFLSIVISHLFHLFSIFSLYYLTFKIYQSRNMAIITSFLYLVSPSGIFLSAGYTESFFSFFIFTGFIFFEKDYNFLASLAWCVASTIRSNGLLWSIFFLHSAFIWVCRFFKYPGFILFFRIIKFGICSLIVGIGFFWIQYRAYVEFCHPEKKRSWCFESFPLIYSFVQSYYWNVGFFKYFTLPQIPNFILVSPAIYISMKSVIYYFFKNKDQFKKTSQKLNSYYIIQLLMTIICIFTTHIQIFTRMISCLPGIYWWLANCLLNDWLNFNKTLNEKKESLYWTRIWILYGMVQAVLFGAFLPPA
ncbi:GPI-anchor transamidase GPI18 [Pneumocystis jirovecii RU7]|uniref:GPI mannosyltransferase 2 n=1 Tax=Pneumocystis jirovecii (strain RU7) TaxID=1408657 RepID=A0A0W4ZK76_PNEJ7|nr:GPI-anchor transamidase GPI18 [Pneumocystis jirovecii RU7]KTW28757.1 hypothetical protein T551_02607 [Pneumocystis jirovecii RU7]